MIIVISSIVLMSIIFILVFTNVDIKNQKKLMIPIICLLLGLISFIFLLNFASKKEFNIHKIFYQYNINYVENTNNYEIYKTINGIYVYSKTQPNCIKAPCPQISSTEKINFSKENMKKINNFFKEIFKDKNTKTLSLSSSDLTITQNQILKSIIQNRESLLNEELYTYKIITNKRFITMMDDGGSNTDIYYELNIKNRKVTKLEDKYVGFKGYEYQRKVLLETKLKQETLDKVKTLIETLIREEDINDNHNYNPYVINLGDFSKTIYNEKSINELEKILKEIDNYSSEN